MLASPVRVMKSVAAVSCLSSTSPLRGTARPLYVLVPTAIVFSLLEVSLAYRAGTTFCKAGRDVILKRTRPDYVTRRLRSKQPRRSEERRVGKECRSRWSPHH